MELKSRGQQSCAPLGHSRGKSVPRLLEAALISWLTDPPAMATLQPLFSSHLFLSLCFRPHVTSSDSDAPASLLQAPCVDTGLTWTFQDTPPILKPLT